MAYVFGRIIYNLGGKKAVEGNNYRNDRSTSSECRVSNMNNFNLMN